MPKKNNDFVIIAVIITGLAVALGVSNGFFTSIELPEFQVAEAVEHEEVEDLTKYEYLVELFGNRSQYTFPLEVRYQDTSIRMMDANHGTFNAGLPRWIPDNNSTFVSQLSYNDLNGYELESGLISYYFTESECAMSIYNWGRIVEEQIPLIKGDMWIVKEALNGTDNWIDIPQNNLPCTVDYVSNSTGTYLTSTKSDSLGTIIERYTVEKDRGLKHHMTYLNNDTAKDGTHKYSFSNILLETPAHISIIGSNPSDPDIPFYKAIKLGTSISIPLSFNGGQTFITDSFDITRDDIQWEIIINNATNATAKFYTTSTFEWHFDSANEDVFNLIYDFDQSLDQFWNMRVVNNGNSGGLSSDVYIDFANVNSTLATGESIEIDPILNFPSQGGRHVFSGQCRDSGQPFFGTSGSVVGGVGAVTDQTLTVGGGTARFIMSGNFPKFCDVVAIQFDVSALPDDMNAVDITWSGNQTSDCVLSGVAPNLCGIGYELHHSTSESILGMDAGTFYAYNRGGDGIPNTLVNEISGNVFKCVDGTNSINPCSITGGNNVDGNTMFGLGERAYQQICTTPTTCAFFDDPIKAGVDRAVVWLCPNHGGGLSPNGCSGEGYSAVNAGATRTFRGEFDSSLVTVNLQVNFDVFTVPDPPTDLIVTSTLTQCELDWEAPLFTGGTGLIGYKIERETGQTFQTLVADTGQTITFFNDATIFPDVTFTYRVLALNIIGESAPSNEFSCGVPVVPSAVFNLDATNVALNTVALDWIAPFNGNSPITSYNITRLNASSFVTILDGDTGNANTEFIDSTVTVNTQFGYKIAAINAIGQGAFSNTAIITTVGLPSPPDNVEVTATGISTATVTWNAPDVGESTITGYLIERKENFTGIFTTIEPFTNNDDTTFNDSLLTSGTEFCYRLKTITNIGQSTTFSDENQATTCATTQDQSDPPDNLVATAIDGSTINVTWDTPLDDGGSTITGYKIERQKEANPFLILFNERQPESNRVLLDTGLEVGTQYTYRITAITAFGDGESGTASDTTDATPQAPPNFSCSAGSTTSITLNWDIPESFSAPTGYQIDRRTVGGAFSTLVADTADTATQFLDGGLPVDSIFEYRILGHTSEGDTDFSQTITCATLGTPDFPPEDLQGDFTTTIPHQMVLAWDIPDTFGIPITEFRIERDDGVGFNQIATVSGSTFLFVDQDPDNDVDQSYRIFTVGTEGESAPSIAIPFPANQTSHWHYEKTVDDTGDNKNSATIFGTANFNGTGHIGKAFIFNNTRIEVDPSQESDYDFDNSTSFGITSYYKAQAGATIPAFDDEWQIREQEINVAFTVNCNFNITPPFSIDMTLNTGVGFCHVFKVFDKADIVGKILNVTWAGTGSSADMRTRVYDGSYDRDTPSDFPLTTGTNGFTAVLKGGGVLHAIDRTSVFSSVTDSVTMTMAGSTQSQVTIAVSLRDPSNTVNQFMDLTEIKIIGLETWTWDSSASRTMEVTGTQNDKGFSNANFTQNTLVSTDQVIVSKAQTLTDTGYKFYVDKNGKPSIKLTNTDSTNEIFVQATTDVTDDILHFIGFGYNGNGTASGISMNIDGSSVTPTIITDTLTGSILNNEALNIGGTSTGTNLLIDTTIDETRIFGSGTLDEDSLDEVANDEIETVIPINATITIAGATFADISSETPLIIMTSGYPLPTINTIDLFNFTATNVNSQVVGLIIDGVNGQFTLDPSLFNIMSSLSNYTATGSLTNSQETFNLFSNFDIQVPLFTFTGDFFFQQQRNPTFDLLSFNYTQTLIPFDLDCNFKSTLFGNGTTVEFDDVFFVQLLQPVEPILDVVVACIDPNQPIVDPTAPSFGGINTILSFVSFGDTTGVGNFIQFTNNYGDFFGVGLPFLFIIILAAAFTGRSAPTGILIIAVSIGIMAAMGILEVDPFMWGIILVLVILGVLGGKKFL